MNFWFYFLGLQALVLLFKWYMIRSIAQTYSRANITRAYAVGSIGSWLWGIYVLLNAFDGGIIGLSVAQNFSIALMVSVVFCEGLVGVFFLIDDLQVIASNSWQKLRPKEQPKEESPEPTRRNFLKRLGVLLGAFPFAAFLEGITRGKYNFQVHEHTLYFADLPEAFDGFKLVQFSDLHSGGFDDIAAVQKGFELIQAQGADLILFTGDLVNDLADEIIPYKGLLKDLAAPFGKYSVLGNHDYPEDRELFPTKAAKEANLTAIQQHHADCQFQLLNNAQVKLEKDGQHIRLLGVENWGHGFIQAGDLDQALVGCEKDDFMVLMSHDPSHWEDKVLPHQRHIHLTLAGHTHGMQLGIEALGIKWSPIQYFYKYWAGLYQQAGQYLYVNRGFGFMAFAGRVGIPPEITSITLRKSKH